MLTLAQAAMINDMSVVDMGATNIFNKAPLLAQLAFVKATNGTLHKYLREITAPTVGFRAENVGLAVTAGTDEVVTVTLKYLDATARIDKALADVGEGKDYQIERQSMRNLRAAYFKAEQQVLKGGAGGFDGLEQALSALGTMCLTAGGLFAAGLTSVYMIRSTDDEKDLAVVGGNDGNIQVDPYYDALINEGTTGRQFNGYVCPIAAWLSIQLGGSRSIARLANVGTATNTTLNDDFLSTLFDTFPASEPPTHVVMNRRSRGQLQRSRSTVSVSGKLIVQQSPIPTEYQGIPIVCVESLTNDETAVA